MSIKQYKKKYKLGKDSFNKILYVGDEVELFNGLEMRNTWKSKIYWNMIDGAFVDAHPGHVKMGLLKFRNLREFLDKVPFMVPDHEGNLQTLEVYCKKIKSFYKI